MWMEASTFRGYSIMNIRNRYISTVVIGSGAAGLNAASRLFQYGVKDIAILTEGLKCGTSRNTGSDKQTYYKLSLAGSDDDSVRALASDLFKGRAVDGDIALAEASLSASGFLRLAEMGVPFPTNRYGEYIGYKTDHDPHKRATSAGPYTSKFMTEALERDVKGKGIEIIDGYQAVRLIAEDGRIRGVVAMNRKSCEFLFIEVDNLVMATGGPAGIYQMSVYPESQFGATGLAFEIGVKGKNLTEWQYGLSSTHPRWNVSGSYMQVLPRFVSVDSDGVEYDFLSSYQIDRNHILSLVFLKGYQWPFDVRKLESGSSIIDILCYLELEKGRRVYLDYIHNPDFADIDFSALSAEAREYLEKAGATGRTPIERLRAMNEPSYQFYLDKGIDLEKEYLEISLSAQHNNGGLSINLWWESNIKGLFPVGEVAASHGVYRPGGSALNAGQAGSARAALYISASNNLPRKDLCDESLKKIDEIMKIRDDAGSGSILVSDAYAELREIMSINASAIRSETEIRKALSYVDERLSEFHDVKAERDSQIWLLFEYRNALLTSQMYLYAMLEYIRCGGKSRGSALYTDKSGTVHPGLLDERFTYTLEDESSDSDILEVWKDKDGNLMSSLRKARPIPADDDFFERIWARYREDQCIF